MTPSEKARLTVSKAENQIRKDAGNFMSGVFEAEVSGRVTIQFEFSGHEYDVLKFGSDRTVEFVHTHDPDTEGFKLCWANLRTESLLAAIDAAEQMISNQNLSDL